MLSCDTPCVVEGANSSYLEGTWRSNLSKGIGNHYDSLVRFEMYMYNVINLLPRFCHENPWSKHYK